MIFRIQFEKIGEFSFQAAAFSYVNLPEGLQTIEEMSFNYVQTEYIEIPSTVTTIETRAFSHNHALKTLVIPESVTSIGELLFREDGSLTD
ncbi:MAG: leucine-rich repeat protein [Lachnospiraceae bacterium]|nr:leucine-rich repeat protein [Lachnospiraceae bacterium]